MVAHGVGSPVSGFSTADDVAVDSATHSLVGVCVCSPGSTPGPGVPGGVEAATSHLGTGWRDLAIYHHHRRSRHRRPTLPVSKVTIPLRTHCLYHHRGW